jgi:hypothetical protein
MSRRRCDLADLRPSIISEAAVFENTPLFLFATVVKSAGFDVNVLLSGPFPFPSTPWQPAQFDKNSCFPSRPQPDVFEPIQMLPIIRHFTAILSMAFRRLI